MEALPCASALRTFPWLVRTKYFTANLVVHVAENIAAATPEVLSTVDGVVLFVNSTEQVSERARVGSIPLFHLTENICRRTSLRGCEPGWLRSRNMRRPCSYSPTTVQARLPS
jgi:hypothetical protein